MLRSNEVVSSFLGREQINSKKHFCNGSGKLTGSKRIAYESINSDNRSSLTSNILERGEKEMEYLIIDSLYSLFHKVVEDMVIPKVF